MITHIRYSRSPKNTCGLDNIPVFVKAGSIIPVKKPLAGSEYMKDEDIDVLVTDLAGLVIHDTDFAGGETVHPVDVALEPETVIVEETLLFEPKDFEGIHAAGVHALQVSGQDLHDILEDDILENEIAPADLKGVKLSHDK